MNTLKDNLDEALERIIELNDRITELEEVQLELEEIKENYSVCKNHAKSLTASSIILSL